MIHQDRFGLEFSAASDRAAEIYREAIDAFLGARESVESLFNELLAEDPECALGRIGLARLRQSQGRGAEARAEADRALALALALPDRQTSHVAALASVVRGQGAKALAAVTAHLDRYPRDIFVLVPVAGVFGLFGFSGQTGREEALFNYLAPRRQAFSDDGWFLAALAFAECETGRLVAASEHIDQAWEINSASANTAHIRAHVEYERGRSDLAAQWLPQWLNDYRREGIMHCHLAWHVALAHLRAGELDSAYGVFQAAIQPLDSAHGPGAWGPPLNLVTDASSFLFRAQIRGMPVTREHWQVLLERARSLFPRPGLRFADVHIALCLAMAGDVPALNDWLEAIDGPTASVIRNLGQAFAAIEQSRWSVAVDAFETTRGLSEVLGGSRAQRDLLVEAWQYASGFGQPISNAVSAPRL